MQITGGEDDVVEQPSTLGNLRLEARLVQVLGACLNDILLVVLDADMIVNIDFYFFALFVAAGGGDSRPVELAQLHKTELDIARLVLQEGLPGGGDMPGDLLEGCELQFRKLDAHGVRCAGEKANSLRQELRAALFKSCAGSFSASTCTTSLARSRRSLFSFIGFRIIPPTTFFPGRRN